MTAHHTHTDHEIEHIAKVAHAATQAHKNDGETIVSWEDGKEDSINAVKTALIHPIRTSEELHEEWVAATVAAGKTHPHAVPYAELPKHIQARNDLFYDVVDSLKHKAL